MGNNDSSVETFLQWIKASDNIVFFGGAGVSTESGIPDFRSVDGLNNQKYDYPPETILSHTFYRKHPQEFYRFYRDQMLCLDAEPNITHYKLAELEKAGKLKGVVTQNIDGLHQKAGSKNVMELHGSVLRNYCERCLQFVSAEEILNSTDVPKCPKCGGLGRRLLWLREQSGCTYPASAGEAGSRTRCAAVSADGAGHWL